MAHANRHFIASHIWHLTHRCHKGEFLLKFSKDRARWIELLFEARKRYHLSILNFIVTSNHINLLVADYNGRESIPKAMQLIAGRSGQEYDRRKGSKGAFWDNSYHATWYAGIAKAPWTPLGWVFGAAWVTIMIYFGVYMAYLWPVIENKNILIG